MSTILIAGGSGFIGRHLAEALRARGDTVRLLSRAPKHAGEFAWNPAINQIDDNALQGVDGIVNLAGAGIAGKRWTIARKKEIIESRVFSAQVLREAIQRTGLKPKAYISASAIGYYGNSGEKIMRETDPPVDDSFMVQCCRAWEAAGLQMQEIGVRTAVLRLGIVLGADGGAQHELNKTLRFGLGIQFGNGRAWWSCININDLCRMILFALDNTNIQGIYNAVAPNPLRNREVIQALAARNKIPAFVMPVPAFVFRIGFGEMAATILNSNRVGGEKIVAAGFEFQHHSI